MKKIFDRSFFLLSVFIVVALFSFISLHGSHFVQAQTSYAINGYAWSDNIGWISFSGSNPNYGITEDQSGNLTGYAWSDAVGWIKFGGLSGFPSGPGTSNENALIASDGTLHGWARVCAGTIKLGDSTTSPTQAGDCSTMTSRTDGWDGWISLDGTNYGVNFASGNGQYSQSAYTWGSDVIGWITFNPSNLSTSSNPVCVPALEACGGGPGGSSSTSATVNLSITPSSVATGTAATLSWNTGSVTTCSAVSSGISTDTHWNGALTTLGLATSTGTTLTTAFPATGTETYSLTCNVSAQAGGGTLTSNLVTLTVTGQGGSSGPNGTMCTSIPQNANLCSGSAIGNSASSLVSTCNAASGAPLCQYICASGYHQVANQCVANGSVKEQ